MFRLLDILRSLARKLFRLAVSPRPSVASRFRPGMLALEGRDVPTPVVTIAALSDGAEGGSNAVFRFTRTDTTGSLSVGFSRSGTAAAGSDYTYPMFPAGAEFAPGQATTDVTVTITNDSTTEATETVTYTLHTGIGYTVGSPSSATVNIYDNETPVVAVSDVSNAVEGGADGVMRFTRTGDLSGAITVNFTVGGTATSGADFTALGTSVVLAAGKSYADVAVDALADALAEGSETVSVTVTSGTGYTLGNPSSDSLTIENRQLVTIAVLSDASESGIDGVFRLTRTETAGALTVSLSVGGTATSEDDYPELLSAAFADGKATIDVVIVAEDDSDDEPTETIVATVVTGSGHAVGSPGSATMNILDDDPTPSPPPPAPPTNAAPVFVSPLSTGNTITPGQPFYFQVLATDADNEWLSYTALQMPQGLSIDANTGVVTGTMAAAGAPEAGTTMNMTFEVGDGTVLVQQQVEFTVTSTFDPWLVNTALDDAFSDDVDLEDGVPLDGNDKVSLRAAIQQANYNSGEGAWPTFIGFDPTVFGGGAKTISLRGKMDEVTGGVRIAGTGMANLTITGGTDNQGMFAFAKDSQAVVTDLTISGGANLLIDKGSGSGGGVANLGSLFLDRVKITACEADGGAGLFTGGGGNHTTLLNSQVTNNNATGTGGIGFGGGVHVSNGFFVADDSLIENNSTAGRGGGVGINASGAALLFDTDVRDNSSKNGGGIYVSAKLTLAMLGGEVEDNEATHNGDGGGMNAEGTVRVKNVGFNNNASAGKGGAIDVKVGKIKIETCSFSGNAAVGVGPTVAQNADTVVDPIGVNTGLAIDKYGS